MNDPVARWSQMKTHVATVAPDQVTHFEQSASREQTPPLDAAEAWDRVWPIPFYSNNKAKVGDRIVTEARTNAWFVDKEFVGTSLEWTP